MRTCSKVKMTPIKQVATVGLLVLFGSYLQCVFGQDTPAAAPTTTERPPNYGFLPCSICPNRGEVVTEPDVPITTDLFGSVTDVDTTCGELAQSGLNAEFPLSKCATILSSTIYIICGCELETTPTSVPPAPVEAPVAAPAEVPTAPVAAPVAAPVEEPVAAPVAAPAPAAPTAPTATPPQFSALIKIRLTSVPGVMPDETVAAYNTVISLALKGDTEQDITASLTKQEVVVNSTNTTTGTPPSNSTASRLFVRRQLHLRILQAVAVNGSSVSLDTFMNVAVANTSDDATSDEIASFAINAINRNDDSLIQSLKSLSATTFFSGVTSVVASEASPSAPMPSASTPSAPVAAPVKAPAPAPKKKEGLSGGAVAGIMIGIVAIVIGAIFISALTQRKNFDTPSRSVQQNVTPVAASSVKKSGGSAGSARRKVIVPPGKLGIVTDTTSDGPTIHKVKDDSPVKNLLFAGDVIIACGDVDTRAMSASAITDLMVASIAEARVFTVLSSVDTSPELGGLTRRKVIAPPGKLGIVIDTTEKGPMVHKVKEDSPLNDLMFPGDYIIACDDVDTRAMSASAITNLMLESASKQRTFTVLSKDLGESEMITLVSVQKSSSNPHVPKDVGEPDIYLESTSDTPPEEAEITLDPAPTPKSEEIVAPVAVATAAVATAAAVGVVATSSSAKSSDPEGLTRRTVIAPPGKLGIVIDTTIQGPVVHKVKDDSPLSDLLFPGDVIIACDDVDTRAMSASAITALMVKSASRERTLTVLSKDEETTTA